MSYHNCIWQAGCCINVEWNRTEWNEMEQNGMSKVLFARTTIVTLMLPLTPLIHSAYIDKVP